MVTEEGCAWGEQSTMYRLVASLCCAPDIDVTLCVIKNCRDFSRILAQWVWCGASDSEFFIKMGDSRADGPWMKGLWESLLQGWKCRSRVEACNHWRWQPMEESVLGWDLRGVSRGWHMCLWAGEGTGHQKWNGSLSAETHLPCVCFFQEVLGSSDHTTHFFLGFTSVHVTHPSSASNCFL